MLLLRRISINCLAAKNWQNIKILVSIGKPHTYYWIWHQSSQKVEVWYVTSRVQIILSFLNKKYSLKLLNRTFYCFHIPRLYRRMNWTSCVFSFKIFSRKPCSHNYAWHSLQPLTRSTLEAIIFLLSSFRLDSHKSNLVNGALQYYFIIFEI